MCIYTIHTHLSILDWIHIFLDITGFTVLLSRDLFVNIKKILPNKLFNSTINKLSMSAKQLAKINGNYNV